MLTFKAFLLLSTLGASPNVDMSQIPAEYRNDPRVKMAMEMKMNKPQTCDDQCDQMEKVGKKPCEETSEKKQRSAQAKKSCSDNFSNIAQARVP